MMLNFHNKNLIIINMNFLGIMSKVLFCYIDIVNLVNKNEKNK